MNEQEALDKELAKAKGNIEQKAQRKVAEQKAKVLEQVNNKIDSMKYYSCDYKKPTAFVIGNEGNGLTDEMIALSDFNINIPMSGEVESLNAAVATSILCFEAARQRGK